MKIKNVFNNFCNFILFGKKNFKKGEKTIVLCQVLWYNKSMLKIRLCKTYAEAILQASLCARDFGKNPKTKLFAFCEDKLTMSLETEIARACGGGTFNVQVTTFSRFINRFGRVDIPVLDKETSSMVVKNILLEKADGLACFKRSAYNPGTAVTLYELIAQLKSASVTTDDLTNGLASLSGALKGKVQDILTVYNAYEDYVRREGCLDSNSYLSLMEGVLGSGNFTGCSAMLVGFSSLTRQGVDIVKMLAKRMENLTVFLLSGENEQLYTNELKMVLMREIDGFCIEESDEILGEERERIRNFLFEPTCFSLEEKIKTDKIYVYEANDYFDELQHIASIIRREVLNGKRYKDFAIALGTPENYRPAIYNVFSSYGIPYFLDDRKKLSTHPIAGFIEAYLNLKRCFGVNEFLKFIKNPYFDACKADLDSVENFLKRNAITAKRLKSGLNLTENPIETYGEGYDLFETFRLRCLEVVGCKCSLTKEWVNALTWLMEEFKVGEKVEEQAKRLRLLKKETQAAFTQQALVKINEILKNVARILGEVPSTAVEFKNVVLSGFSACEISVLPQLADAVYVGNYKDCKYLEHKILFAGGLTGDVPFTKSDTALLTDADLNTLDRFECIVEPKIKIVNKRERENVGTALLSFKERLYLSSSAVDGGGKLTSRSRITEYFTRMFVDKQGECLRAINATVKDGLKNKGEKTSRAYSTLKYNAPHPSMLQFIQGAGDFKVGIKDDFVEEASYFSALRDVLPEQAERAEGYLAQGGKGLVERLECSGKMILGKDTVSASVLESYFGCPFACFMRYGLRLEENKTVEIKTNEFGNFLHSVLEEYVKIIKEDGCVTNGRIKSKEDSDEAIEQIFNALQGDVKYSKFLDADKYAMIFELVKKEAKRVAYVILEQFRNSGFLPVETEATFGDGKKYKAITLKTPHGVKKINGKIDRVDRSGNYVRIIDYKTGKTHEEDEKFYTGNNLQLYLYMNAFLQDGDEPCGAYYFPVSNAMQKDKNVYAMRGKTIGEEDVLKLTDASLANGKTESDVLDAKFTYKNGALTPSSSSKKFLTPKEFKGYLKYAIKISEKGVTEIADGVIAPSPYDEKCMYCEYSAICGFEEDLHGARKEKSVSVETVLGAVED